MWDKLIILNTIRGDLKILRRLLRTETDENLGSVPKDCADLNKPDVIELLRSAGAFVDDRFRITLLHVAVATSNIESVKLLIEMGCDINSYNNRNESLLHFAVASELHEIVELLVKKGANINEQLPKESALSCAVRIHNEQLTKFLLDHGADVHIENDDGTSPLIYAAKSHSPVIPIMIMARADPKSYSVDIAMEMNKPINFSFFLSFSILRNNSIGDVSFDGSPNDNIKYLLEKEAKCSRSRLVKRLALRKSLRRADYRTVKFLLDSGAELGADDYTTLHLAAMNRNDDIAKYFLDSGIDINVRTNNNVTPLRIAALHGNDKVCKLLLSRGADINIIDSDGITPLSLAVWRNHSTIVKLFLEYGAKVCSKCLSIEDFKLAINDPMLYHFVQYEHEIIKLLIEHVAKLVSINCWDDEKVLKIIAKDFRQKFYYENCIEELEK